MKKDCLRTIGHSAMASANGSGVPAEPLAEPGRAPEAKPVSPWNRSTCAPSRARRRLHRRVQAARVARPAACHEDVIAAVVQRSDGLDRARRPLKRAGIVPAAANQRSPIEEGGGAHAHVRQLAMSLFERFGQADIEEIAVERLAPNLAALDQRRKDVLFERAGQGGNEVEDLALQHIDPPLMIPGPGRLGSFSRNATTFPCSSITRP